MDYIATADVERFTGLNVRGSTLGSTPLKLLRKNFRVAFSGQKWLLFSIIKERRLYSRISFRGTLENRGERESLAQRIFPPFTSPFTVLEMRRAHVHSYCACIAKTVTKTLQLPL